MQKSLSFNKGITTSPSDLVSDDTELSASRDLIFRNGEMQPLRQAKLLDSLSHKLLYIHKGADYTNAITYDGSTLYCGTLSNDSISENEGSFTVGKVYDISSVGNTLVVATDNGLHYILFKEGKYIDLGTELPRYNFYPAFRMWTNLPLGGNTGCFLKGMTSSQLYKASYSNGKFTGCSAWKGEIKPTDNESFFFHHEVNEGSTNEANVQNAIQGHVAELIRIVKENNRFAFPFFVRCAMRLYDGSYARISVPVACYPTVNRNCYFTPVTASDYKESMDFTECFMYAPFHAPFQYRIEAQGIDKWKDIVKEFVVFATDDVMPFYLDKEWRIELPSKTSETTYRTLVTTPTYSSGLLPDVPVLQDDGIYHFEKGKYNARDVIVPTYKSDNEIINEMISKTQFYKLFSVGVESVNTSDYVSPTIASNVVATLTSQEQLPVDDYYGWTSIVPQKVLTYNNRINLFNVIRCPFIGAHMFTCATATGGSSSSVEGTLRFYVHIATSVSMEVVSSTYWPQDLKVADSWFFYPDPRAVDVVVWDTTSGRGIKIPLKTHPYLNGAYAFRYLPLANRMTSSNVSSPPSPSPYSESLDSQIFTSVVNNPFVFQASGDNTVGTGSILGIAANTEPISQGQFGQYPLIVFTTEGIYGLSVNSEGLYSASYPISREVCNNSDSITSTGNVVYFTSDKGLMAVSGGTVRCVSPQLSGANPPYSDATVSFLTFVRNAFLAYDYRDSLLFIYNVSYDYAYVYNLLDGTFATISLGSKRIQRAVSNYPDTLLQDADNNVYSFRKIPVAQDDTNAYSGTFTTRPLKLGSSIQLKTIHQIVHLFNSADGTLKLRVYASNDCRNWVELHSLHGKPWKYYRFSYTLSNISASDTFAGTVIDFTPRFTNKIR